MPQARAQGGDEYIGPVKVTVTRPDTGEVLQEKVISNDYMLVTNGNRYVKSWQMWGGTHQINVAVRKPAAPAQPERGA